MKRLLTSLSSRILPLFMGLLVFASVALLAQQLASGSRSRQSATNSSSRPGIANPSQQDLCGQVEALKGATPPVPKLTITPIPQTSSLIALHPDLEYIPIYPGSDEDDTERNAVSQKSDHIGMRFFDYFPPADANLEQVVAFYREALSKNGWHSVGHPLPAPVSDEQALRDNVLSGRPYYYAWTDPEDRTPWHFYVRVVDIVNLPGDRVEVSLAYGRYPDTIKNLSLYPGASAIEISCSEEAGGLLNQGLPVTTIKKTYLTNATPEQVADYYNTTLLPFAWRFFDEEMVNRVMRGQVSDVKLIYSRQVGDINSGDGLIFEGMANYDERGVVHVPRLNITATRAEDGRTKVQLKVKVTQQHPASP